MRMMRMIVSMVGLLFFGSFSLIFAAHGPANALSGLAGSRACPRAGTEIVFIDPSVMDPEEIINDLGENAEVVRLTSGKNGVEEISEYLEEKENIAAIRIITHGNAGYFVLNREIVHSYFVAENRDRIMAWGNALAEGGDILLYGCNLAATARGQALVAQIADLTGADVAAATLPTGGDMGSGENWDLDYHCGTIETAALNIRNYPYHLANQVVTNNNDSGAGSLRQTIADVGAGEEITFSIAGSDTVSVESHLSISGKSMAIDGYNNATGNNVTVQVTTPGTSTHRVFHIDASGESINISNMTIKGGDISGQSGDAALGGGIYHQAGTLNLDTVTVSNAKALHGGGIYNIGNMTIQNCTISNNQATITSAGQGGGGIKVDASGSIALISNCTISNNTSGADGGGILNNGGTITTIQNCTISGNTGNNDGGGIQNESGSITAVRNCTFCENTATFKGGGINAEGDGTITTISNCTIANNNLTFGSGWAGGLCVGAGDEGTATNNTTIRNTILANNTVNSVTPAGADYYYHGSSLTDDGYNVVKYSNVAANATGGFNAATDILYNTRYNQADTAFSSWTQGGNSVSGSLNLSTSLADNGGPTQTLAFTGDSFAAASAATGIPPASTWNNSPVADQRGVARTDSQNTSIGAYSENYTPSYYYRSAGNGNWDVTGTWEQSSDSITWEAASETPTDTSLGITIRNDHTVTVNTDVAIDQTTIEFGATLTVDTAVTLTIADGDSTDLTANGNLSVSAIGALGINSGASVDSNAAFTCSGVLSFDDGGANNGTISIASAAPTISSLTAGSGTITYDGADQTVPAKTYNAVLLSGTGTKTFLGTTTASAGITVSESLTVCGDGPSTTIVQAAPSAGTATSRVLNIQTGNTVTLSDMTVRYGKTVENGGGIYNGGTLTLSNVHISENNTTKFGGGIYSTGTLEMTNSSISSNSASDQNRDGGRGGGIYATSALTIADSTIATNTTTAGLSYYGTEGGGIYSTASLAITNSTIEGNQSNNHYHYTRSRGGGIYSTNSIELTKTTIASNTTRGLGGGIYISTSGGTSSITDCTVAGNETIRWADWTALGGGLYLAGAVPLNIVNSTVAENATATANGGGGIYCDGALTVKNSVIVNNDSNSGATQTDYYYNNGSLTDNGYNVVEYQDGTSTGSGKTFTATTDMLYNTKADGTTGYSTWNQNNSDLANQNPSLATSLADNGGPTQTLALEAESFAFAAIPHGSDPHWNGSPTTGSNYYDQRGVETPAGTAISIGAYSDPPTYYMAKSDDNWSSVATWYTNTTGGTDPGDYTTAATEAPNADNSDGIIVNSNVTVDVDVTIDQTTINSGTTLTVNNGVTLTVADGDGTDFTIDGTMDADGNLDIDGSISISATGSVDSDGTFDATGGNVTFTGAGNLFLGGTITSLGTFTCGTSTVTLDGTSQSLPAGYTFYNLTKIVTSADTLTFQAGSTTTVTNTLTLQGAGGELLSLRSSSDGDQWEIDPQGTRTVAYLDVKDSNNTSGTDITGTNSIDSGHNTGWTFQKAPTVTTQPVTDTKSSSATGNGDITDLGVPNPTAHGVVWNTAGEPTLADNSTDEGAATATGAFSTHMTGLTPNTTYAVRAYATNAEDTAYGEELSFTTLPSALAPLYFLLNEDEQEPRRGGSR